MWRGPPIAVNGSHPCKSLSCQLNNRLLNVQLFSFHTVIVHTGREKSGRNDLTKAERSRLHCLWLLRPQSSRKNTSAVTALKALGDLMPVATVCHCDGTDLWTNDPSVPFRIMTGQSQIYLGCRELLVLHPPGCGYCRDAGPTPFTIPLPQPASVFIDF